MPNAAPPTTQPTDGANLHDVKALLSALFGAKGQVVVGVLCTIVAIAAWAYWTFVSKPTVGTVFHISMFFGVVACYAIVATGLGYRATERVEQVVAEDVDVEHADEVIEA